MGEAGYCAACDRSMPDGPDACLGLIPGVSQACCGHGDAEAAYVVLGGAPSQHLRYVAEAILFRGAEARRFFELIRSGIYLRHGSESPADKGSPHERRGHPE